MKKKHIARPLARHYALSLMSEQGGAAIIEFAIIAPMFIVLLLGVLHFSIAFFTKHALESGLHEGLQLVAINQADPDATIRGAISKRSFGFVNPSQLNINITSYNNVQEAYLQKNGTPGAGAAGQVTHFDVQYTMNYEFFNLK